MPLLERLRSGWTGLRFLQVILGGLILYSSLEEGHIAGILLGGIFTLLALFTEGVCCTGAACQIPVSKEPSAVPGKTVYEELAEK